MTFSVRQMDNKSQRQTKIFRPKPPLSVIIYIRCIQFWCFKSNIKWMFKIRATDTIHQPLLEFQETINVDLILSVVHVSGLLKL